MEHSVITGKQIEDFLKELEKEGKSSSEIQEYRRNLRQLCQMAAEQDCRLDKELLAEWKRGQKQRGIAAGTVTNEIVKVNRFLRYLGHEELCFPNGGRQNLAGKRFGDLIAIEPLPEQRVGRSICWRCRCMVCGKEKAIAANQLTKGVQTSCGCRRASRLQETNGYIDGTCLKSVFSDTMNRKNTSGYKGVFRKRGKWAASIQYKKKNYYLGSYDRIEDAAAARKAAEDMIREDAKQLLEQYRREATDEKNCNL